MSTVYRVVVTCDEQKSDRCLGLLEVTAGRLFGDERVLPAAEEHGWLRGYGAEQTDDVCPACRVQLATEHAGVGVRLVPGGGANA